MKPFDFAATGPLQHTLLILGLILPALWNAPAQAGTVLEFNLSLYGGHDDDVLASPGDSLALPSIEAGYAQIAPAVTGQLRSGHWRSWASALYAHNRYSSEEAGAWNRVVGGAGATLQLSSRVDIRLHGSAERIRRTEFDDLDVDRLNITPNLVYRPASDVQIELALGLSRDHYPARRVFAPFRTGSDSLQTDRPLEASLDVGLYRWNRLALSGGFARLRAGSSQITSEYAGYRLHAAADFLPGLGIEGRAGFTYEFRDYEDREIRRLGDRFRLFDRVREDHSREFTLTAARDLSRQVRIRLDASRIDYVSDLSTVSFDQSRVQARVDFRLGPWGSGSAGAGNLLRSAGQKLPEMAPLIRIGAAADTERVVTFRFRARGVTRLGVAGSFNDWTPAPMSDEDGDGVWEATIRLPAGLYRYMFLAEDTEWLKPSGAAAYEDDGFGLENGVLHVP